MIGGRGRRKRSGVILRKKNGRTQHKKTVIQNITGTRVLRSMEVPMTKILLSELPMLARLLVKIDYT